MDRILIVSGSTKGIELISECLKELQYVHIDTLKSGAAARRKLLEMEYVLVIINTPLIDEQGIDLSLEICEKSMSGIILIVKAENYDEHCEMAEDQGVFVLSKPLNRAILYKSIKFVLSSVRRMQSLSGERNKLLKKIEDIKLVDRAKCILIEKKNMTEQEAHKYIEKAAMNNRLTRREIAEKIIEKLEVGQ